ncbi:trypsin-like cysteine/serine peptidase domain-containing protein [Hypoxylon sp. FL1284]|nr:trypsin-like cysteine/serine peptidase domain-containing protein [Hypoxylon sp. FL1284]
MVASLAPLATAILLLSQTIGASPVPEIRDNVFTNPIGIPEGKIASLFSGPIPDLVTLSSEDIHERNVTDMPQFVPEGIEDLEDSEIAKRYIFGADNRVLWTDNKVYPFSAMGKIEWSTGVYCSGALIGPRHVATAKHCAPLDNPGVSLRFMPGFYNGEQFAGAYVTTIVHLPGYSVHNPDADACDIKEDWAIFILDARLGDQRGYLGAKVIEQSLVQNPVLLHLGYPGDLANGQRPYRQDRITVRNRFACDATGGLSTDADVAGGMSGGPIWQNDNGNRYQLGVLSATSSAETVFASGNNWLGALSRSRQDFP